MADSVPVMDVISRFAAEASASPWGERLSVHLADGVLALLAGRRSSEGQALRAFFARTESAFGAGLLAHAACMRLSEIDDIHRPSAVTASAIALPVALAMQGMQGMSPVPPQRFADALMVGQTLSVRLSLALGGAELMAAGLWPSYLVAPWGAAATAARMLGLPPERMAHALAIALAQTPRSVGRSRGARPARWLLFAHALRSGCMAALAAADGVDGDPELLSLSWLQTVGTPAAHMAPLQSPAPVLPELSIKPHCAAKQTLAAIHALQELLSQGLDATAIEAMELRVPPAYAAMIDREPASRSRLASMVSVRWQLALAALRPAGLDDVARNSPASEGPLNALADKVEVIADPALAGFYPAAWPAHLRVWAGGRRHEVRVMDSAGDPALPWGVAQIRDKARRVLGPSPEVDTVELAFSAATDSAALQALCSQLHS